MKDGVNITSSTKTLTLTKNIIITVLYCSVYPPVRLVGQCIVACAVIASSVASPKTVMIGPDIHLVSGLCEQG